MEKLDLKTYRGLISGVPLPTDRQKQLFVDYVSHSHSWYKHLPLQYPGAPFYFFIDKYAGCDYVVYQVGKAEVKERETRGFHYSAIPTNEYRERFGYLSYGCALGTQVINREPNGTAVPIDKSIMIPDDNGHLNQLPNEILSVGMTRLTSLIHAICIDSVASRLKGYRNTRNVTDWPEESGGQNTVDQIIRRQNELNVNGRRNRQEIRVSQEYEDTNPLGKGYLMMGDQIIFDLVRPEQQRQQQEMIRAINRVCDVIRSS